MKLVLCNHQLFYFYTTHTKMDLEQAGAIGAYSEHRGIGDRLAPEPVAGRIIGGVRFGFENPQGERPPVVEAADQVFPEQRPGSVDCRLEKESDW